MRPARIFSSGCRLSTTLQPKPMCDAQHWMLFLISGTCQALHQDVHFPNFWWKQEMQTTPLSGAPADQRIGRPRPITLWFCFRGSVVNFWDVAATKSSSLSLSVSPAKWCTWPNNASSSHADLKAAFTGWIQAAERRDWHRACRECLVASEVTRGSLPDLNSSNKHITSVRITE